MKVTSVEKKEKSTVELTIQVEAEAFEAAIQKVYLKTRGRMNVPRLPQGQGPPEDHRGHVRLRRVL